MRHFRVPVYITDILQNCIGNLLKQCHLILDKGIPEEINSLKIEIKSGLI